MYRSSHNRLSVALAFALAGCASSNSGAGGQNHFTLSGTDYELPVRSMLERKFLTVVRQQYDFSCGSAALATLLRYHYADAQSEQSVFLGMWREGDRAQIRRLGFSLLDMKRYLLGRRISADGYQVSLTDIEKAATPGIALIEHDNLRHFVVIKGVSGSRVLVGDPALGIRTIDAREFQKMWNGVVFVINGKTDKAKGSFGRDAEWALVARARATLAMEPVSLEALAVIRPQPFPPEL